MLRIRIRSIPRWSPRWAQRRTVPLRKTRRRRKNGRRARKDENGRRTRDDERRTITNDGRRRATTKDGRRRGEGAARHDEACFPPYPLCTVPARGRRALRGRLPPARHAALGSRRSTAPATEPLFNDAAPIIDEPHMTLSCSSIQVHPPSYLSRNKKKSSLYPPKHIAASRTSPGAHRPHAPARVPTHEGPSTFNPRAC